MHSDPQHHKGGANDIPRRDGNCAGTAAPMIATDAGNSVSISAKLARGKRDIASWSQT
jgi:hypothetical protein